MSDKLLNNDAVLWVFDHKDLQVSHLKDNKTVLDVYITE